MKHVRALYILHAAQNLVHKTLDMIVGQRLLRINNPMQISLHQIGDAMHVFKCVLEGEEYLANQVKSGQLLNFGDKATDLGLK